MTNEPLIYQHRLAGTCITDITGITGTTGTTGPLGR